MSKVTKEILKKAYKPYDVVTNKNGDVGFIQETDISEDQEEFNHQVQYSVIWLVGKESKVAWFDHDELTKHKNIFIEIAKCLCDPNGDSERWVEKLMK